MLQYIKNLPSVQKHLYQRYWRNLIRKGQNISKKLSFEKMSAPIDFVVLWVDGSDPAWIAEKAKYQNVDNVAHRSDQGAARYRDWDIFQYWFRAVEKYAPWVRNVYLVTCGHVPAWLNLDAPKLRHITHKDIMPHEALPTFNSSAIESCIHRIKGLSEHFVYFNDDIFLNRPVSPEDYFSGGLPNYSAVAIPTISISNSAFDHKRFAAIGAINYKFKGEISQRIIANSEKWFASQYGSLIEFNIFAAQRNLLPGMFFSHMAVPFRKSTFETVWNEFPDLLEPTVIQRFRQPQHVSHQLISLWDIMEGNFHPVPCEHHGKGFWNPINQLEEIQDAILGKKFRDICINDSEFVSHEEYMTAKKVIGRSFELVFPEKSSFEK